MSSPSTAPRGFLGSISAWLQTQQDWSPLMQAALGLLLLLAISTRFLSSSHGGSKRSLDGTSTIPMIPYWLPVLGHIPNMAVSSESLLNWARKTYRGGAFSLNLGGKTNHFVFKPALAVNVMNKPHGIADMGGAIKRVVFHCCGFPRGEADELDQSYEELRNCSKLLLSEPTLGNMVAGTLDLLKTNIVNLVSFTSSPVDQMQWERSNDIELLMTPDGEPAIAASLFPLIRNFVAFTANPSLIGTDFVTNFPDFWSNLWTMDRSYIALLTGLPRWTPWPALTRAHAARRRLTNALEAFQAALDAQSAAQDPGPEWRDLAATASQLNPVLRAQQAVYTAHNLSRAARASLTLSLLWAANANANPLIFWLVLRIYADEALLAAIRAETAPFVHALQPPQEFPIPEPARLQGIDVQGLVDKCPLLKSAYVESLRLDTAVHGFKSAKRDFVVEDPRAAATAAAAAGGGGGGDGERFLVKRGDWVHIALDLHHKDPEYFEDPLVWKAGRHIRPVVDAKGETGKRVAEMGTVRPYGGGESMCKGRAFALKEVLMFTAAIVTFWDIEPAGGGPWKMPRARNGTGTNITDDDTRVWIRRRRLPPT